MNHLRYMKGPLFTMLCTLIRYVTKLTCPKFTAPATLDVWRQLVCTITESLYPISDTHSITGLQSKYMDHWNGVLWSIYIRVGQ